MVQLFNAYAASIGIDLGYQDFDQELVTLPGKYATPDGELLLARDRNGAPAAVTLVTLFWFRETYRASFRPFAAAT